MEKRGDEGSEPMVQGRLATVKERGITYMEKERKEAGLF
jgi:hypothetical protein